CAADTNNDQEERLDAEVRRVDGKGWYRSWLRFAIALARVERSRRTGGTPHIRSAFAELRRDAHPFSGVPRACDLFFIRHVIRDSVVWGLSLLETEADWIDSLESLRIASEGTGSRLDAEDGGPLPIGTLLEVLLPHATNPVARQLVRETIERLM